MVSVPPPWQTQDIGAVGVAGSSLYSNGVFTVSGAGGDIQGTADAFRFDYMTVTGDCTIIARVASVQNIDAWSKAGVMIRAEPGANAANAFIAVTPGNGVTWQSRSTTGGGTSWNQTGGLSAPYWVKLVRSGNTIYGIPFARWHDLDAAGHNDDQHGVHGLCGAGPDQSQQFEPRHGHL